MAFDTHKNLAISTVVTSPGTAGASLSVTTGEGSRFPIVPFNATVWPSGQAPTPANAEIVRVTAIAGDTLTITRGQEATTARAIVAGDLIAATITAKTLTDIETGVNFPNIITAGQVKCAYFIQGTVGAGQNYTEIQPGRLDTGISVSTSQFHQYFWNPNGICGGISTSGSSVTYNTTSDQRLKQDLGAARQDVSEDVLRGTVIHDFQWAADGTPGRGVFAQEAVAVAPFAVHVGTDETDADGHLAHPWAVDYGKYIPDLIVGWQHHNTTIAALLATIAALEARVAALEAAP